MREFAIVGRPNSGKTLFALNFALYLGSKTVEMIFRTFDGLTTCRHVSLSEAKHELCASVPHKTRCLQSMLLKVSLGKGSANFKLTDTCGVQEQIHEAEAVRRGMAQTISLLRSTDFIIHVLDLSSIEGQYDKDRQYNIDYEIYSYGLARRNYLILANKTDLLPAKQQLGLVSSYYPKAGIVPVSALLSQGFKEVKDHVLRNI
ncbi:MAG: GTPase domain-containing protein [Pelosinus sp.]|nr:GTPase domain-containing protein [Pelosinus sp.]